MTSTDTLNIKTSGSDTAIFVQDNDHYAVETLPSYVRNDVQVRLYPGPTSPADRVLTLTTDEAKALAEALLRAAQAVAACDDARAAMDLLQNGGTVYLDELQDESNHARPQVVAEANQVVAEAQARATVAEAVGDFIAFANAHPTTPQIGDFRYFYTAEPSGRNYRIVMHDRPNGAGSVHAFIDRTTGDVYKAEGWKRPAKGVRYNLLTQWDLITEVWTWNSGWLYADRVRKG